jgi:exodeoxyribonuclease VII large subunit
MTSLFNLIEEQKPTYSVSQVSSLLKITLEQTFQNIKVKGEISSLKLAPSGHLYFTLKDKDCILDVVCWRGKAQKLTPSPTDGMEVVCYGTITAYGGRSKYQMILESLEHSGIGNLLAMLELRKKALAAEGLFDQVRKKPLPAFPKIIGVITSPTGAVIRDIIHRIEDRFPLKILIWPVLVQGDQAAEQITKAIEGFNAISPESMMRPDILIVARGGGSFEDLWCFNEENVVRAAAASNIPLISAVGHETDTTLIDYAADLRAPTPTAAAELCVPLRVEIFNKLKILDIRLYTNLKRSVEHSRLRMNALLKGLRMPLLNEKYQRLDDWLERLHQAALLYFQHKHYHLMRLTNLIEHPQKQITFQKTRLENLSARLNRSYFTYVYQIGQKVNHLSAVLNSCSYERTLERGFTVIKGPKGNFLTSYKQAEAENSFDIQFYDGNLALKK